MKKNLGKKEEEKEQFLRFKAENNAVDSLIVNYFALSLFLFKLNFPGFTWGEG